MFKKFGKLDKSQKGYVSTEDLDNVCNFKENEIGNLVTENLTSGFRDQIEFKDLVKNLSSFHNNDEDSKLVCNLLVLYIYIFIKNQFCLTSWILIKMVF